jgi:hypothetical protein
MQDENMQAKKPEGILPVALVTVSILAARD